MKYSIGKNPNSRNLPKNLKGRIISDEQKIKQSISMKRLHVHPKNVFKDGHKINYIDGRTFNMPAYQKKRQRNAMEAKASRPRPERCETCGILESDLKQGLHFDHDHKTGKFRGWLCMRCNLAIGLAKENPDLLEVLANYLRGNT